MNDVQRSNPTFAQARAAVHRPLFPRLALTLWLSAALSACGGGGGGGGSGGGNGGTPPPPPPPTQSSNADLGTLALTGADLEQAFDPDLTSYTAVVGFLTKSVEVAASPADDAATLRIDGAAAETAPVTVALAEGDNDIPLEVTAEDGTTRAYTVTVTRQTAAAFAQDAYLKASNTDGDDQFGNSIALAGDTLAVGAPSEGSAATGIGGAEGDNSAVGAGAVYVFTRDAAGVWSQQAYVKASNTDANDEFGTSVALSGDTLAVGAAAASHRVRASRGNSGGGGGDNGGTPPPPPTQSSNADLGALTLTGADLEQAFDSDRTSYTDGDRSPELAAVLERYAEPLRETGREAEAASTSTRARRIREIIAASLANGTP